MKYTLTFVTFFVFILAAPAQNNKAQIIADSVVNKLGGQFLKEPTATGISIGVYTDGVTRFYNYGSTEKGKNILPTELSVYEIGSITKTFSAYLLAKAVLDKKVSLNDNIQKYIKGNYPNLQYQGHPIKLLHLVNFTSGLPDWIPATPDEITKANDDSVAFLRSRIYEKYTRKDFFDALRLVKIDTIPGFKKQHSNGAAQLLAYILEDIYNTPYETLVEQTIAKPNGMNHTFFLKPSEKRADLVKGYNEHGIWVPRFNMPVLQGGGGLNSTTEDLVKYIRMQLDDNPIINLLHKKTLDAGGYEVGLTWYHYNYGNGLSQTWFQGGTSGCLSYVYIYPELNSGVVLLANGSSNAIYSKLSGIAYSLMQQMVPKKQ